MEGEWPARVPEEERAQQLLDTATKIKSKYGEVRRAGARERETVLAVSLTAALTPPRALPQLKTRKVVNLPPLPEIGALKSFVSALQTP